MRERSLVSEPATKVTRIQRKPSASQQQQETPPSLSEEPPPQPKPATSSGE